MVTLGSIFGARSAASDSANSGGFDPAQAANGFTDLTAVLANTDDPVAQSASYAFVTGDIGAWLYIHAGSSWYPGWYEIANVSAGTAFLKAAIGEAVGKYPQFAGNTVAGCASTASPSGGTWTIDYSQSTSAKYTFTDLTRVSNTTFTSATIGFGRQVVGNVIRINSGTNFTVGYYTITNVTTGTATVNAAAASGASSNGAGSIGGAFANPGQASAKAMVAGNTLFVEGNSTYTVTTYDTTSGGACQVMMPSPPGGVPLSRLQGYSVRRGDLPTFAQIPLIYSDSTSMGFASAVINIRGTVCLNIYGKSNNVTSVHCFAGSGGQMHRCVAEEGRYYGIEGVALVSDCYVLNSGRAGQNGIFNVAETNRTVVISPNTSTDGVGPNNGGRVVDCLLIGGRSGITPTSYGVTAIGNTIYNTASHGIAGNANDGYGPFFYERNLFVSIGGYCVSGSQTNAVFSGNAYYSATSGFRPSGMGIDLEPTVVLSGNPFVNAGSGDYSLNATAGAGASARGISRSFFGLSTTLDYSDIGAVQHQDSGGGGGSGGASLKLAEIGRQGTRVF